MTEALVDTIRALRRTVVPEWLILDMEDALEIGVDLDAPGVSILENGQVMVTRNHEDI